jgi:hypothetical protein
VPGHFPSREREHGILIPFDDPFYFHPLQEEIHGIPDGDVFLLGKNEGRKQEEK